MRVNLLRKLALVSVVGVLAASCADPARSVAPRDAAPSLLIEETTIPPTTDGPTSALEPLRLLINTALLKPYYYDTQTLDEAYLDASRDCAKASALIGVALDAYASLVSSQVAPPAGTTWVGAVQAVVADLGTPCKITVPTDALVPNAIVRYVRAAEGAQLRSPDDLVALDIPAGALGGDALVVVTRDPGTAPNERLLGTTLQQYGPVYNVATYPATRLDMTRAQLELFVVGSSPTLVRAPASAQNSLAIVLAPGSGSSSEGTITVLRPIYCALLSGRTGQWGGAEFLKLTPTATWSSTASDLAPGGFGVAFLADSASTSGSGCGQAPPAFDSDALRTDEPSTREPGLAFFRSASDEVPSPPDSRIGTFGVVRIYDPALSSQVRAGLSAKVCGRLATLTNTTGKDVVAVLDPVNRATGRWSSWKLAVLVPPGGATATLALTGGDTKAGEIQLSYGPESLAHVGLSSGCP